MIADTDVWSIVIPVVVGLIGLSGGLLSHKLDERRERTAKRVKVQELMARYRDPLTRAAFDLQSRLYNILRLDFLKKYLVNGTDEEHEYAMESTLHVIGEFFGWSEILRREVQFLDLQDVQLNQRWNECLDQISWAFYDDKMDPVLRVFRSEQRAIGEMMTVRVVVPVEQGGGTTLECLGYASFVQRRREDQAFARWFAKLERDVRTLAAEPGQHDVRLIKLQNRLVDLLDLMDPGFLHFAKNVRTKIPDPVAVPAPVTSAPVAG